MPQETQATSVTRAVPSLDQQYFQLHLSPAERARTALIEADASFMKAVVAANRPFLQNIPEFLPYAAEVRAICANESEVAALIKAVGDNIHMTAASRYSSKFNLRKGFEAVQLNMINDLVDQQLSAAGEEAQAAVKHELEAQAIAFVNRRYPFTEPSRRTQKLLRVNSELFENLAKSDEWRRSDLAPNSPERLAVLQRHFSTPERYYKFLSHFTLQLSTGRELRPGVDLQAVLENQVAHSEVLAALFIGLRHTMIAAIYTKTKLDPASFPLAPDFGGVLSERHARVSVRVSHGKQL